MDIANEVSFLTFSLISWYRRLWLLKRPNTMALGSSPPKIPYSVDCLLWALMAGVVWAGGSSNSPQFVAGVRMFVVWCWTWGSCLQLLLLSIVGGQMLLLSGFEGDHFKSPGCQALQWSHRPSMDGVLSHQVVKVERAVQLCRVHDSQSYFSCHFEDPFISGSTVQSVCIYASWFSKLFSLESVQFTEAGKMLYFIMCMNCFSFERMSVLSLCIMCSSTFNYVCT